MTVPSSKSPSAPDTGLPAGQLHQYRSALADHPDIGPLLPSFVGHLTGYVEKLQQSFSSGDLAALRLVAHQLRGAGKTYGFPRITELAASLDEKLIAGADEATVAGAVEQLTAYLRNVQGYKGDSTT